MSENDRLWGAIAVLRGRMREIVDILQSEMGERSEAIKEAKEALSLTEKI